MLKPLEMGHRFLAAVIGSEDITVDATMGNGHDTLFLAQLSKKVLAFDIQEQAIKKTAERLSEAKVDNVDLILDSHEKVDLYIDKLKAAIFNLGYLPSADKTIITQAPTTIKALEKICQLLEVGGRVAVMIYYGHPGGEVERESVLEFASQLPQQNFTVALYKTVNQINKPPFLLMIEKIRE
ncbi:MAG: class I SAM-dependent methyltransferase [Streptococcus sp.]|nr:class I SAM-dependent methyltransferase [Streptococcus sp.]